MTGANGTSRGAGLTLDQFISGIYLPWVKIHKRSWHMDERVARKHISPFFGHRIMANIHREEIDAWLGEMLNAGLARASCNRFLAVLKAIFGAALERKLVLHSPCADIASFKIYARRERYLNSREAALLMSYLSGSTQPQAYALRLLLLTGARKSEILQARWEDVDLEKGILLVPISKSGRPRPIFLSGAAREVIRIIPATSSWLFPAPRRDKPLSDIYLFWNETRQKLGLADVRIHDLRHTFASLLVNAGHSLYEVQTLLGHSDPRTTMRYAHLGTESLISAAESISRLVSG